MFTLFQSVVATTYVNHASSASLANNTALCLSICSYLISKLLLVFCLWDCLLAYLLYYQSVDQKIFRVNVRTGRSIISFNK
jgi:hypothetical protein